MQLPIYLDAHATTPCDPRVVEAMLPALTRAYGNPASRQHALGWEAEALVDQARDQVASLIGASPSEILFTSGATESDNLAIKGIARTYRAKGRHVVTCATEHKAVLESCRRLAREGFEVTCLPVGRDGRLALDALEAVLREGTILVSVMFANNEIGVLQPIREIGRLCKEKGIIFHCDAVQALAWERVDVQDLGVDLLSISAHKMYGPKGVGALYVRRRNPRVRLQALLEGGGQERGLRPGTLNVPGIVGLGEAAQIARREREHDATRLRGLRNALLDRLLRLVPDAVVHGSLEERLPNNLNISFPGVRGEALFAGLRDLAVSAGAACTAAASGPSHVMEALGVESKLAQSAIRFGLHRFTTQEEVDYAAQLVGQTVNRLRTAGGAGNDGGASVANANLNKTARAGR